MNSLGKNAIQTNNLSLDNIMTSRLPQFIKIFNNIDITENSKRRLRKVFGISFKGKKKPAQRKLVVDYATDLRGTGKRLKGVRYAFRYLANVYNAQIEQQREEILKIRGVRKSLEKRLINFKLGKTGKFCINRDVIELLGGQTLIEIIANILTGEMVLLSVNQQIIDFSEGDGDLEDFTKYYTLSQSNISDLINALSQQVVSGTELGSDAQFAGEIINADQLCIEYPKIKDKDLDKSGKIKTKKGGAFFKYLNHIDFDLSRYGIFKSVIPDNYKENCLYKALEYGGLAKDKLNLLHTFVVNRDVPMSKLKAVCEKLHIQINLRKNDKTDKTLRFGKGHTEVFNIALMDRHYFINEPVKFTMFALKNYFDLKDNFEIDEFRYYYRKRKNSYTIDENRTTDSYKVVKFLLENKEEYLRPITFDKGILETQFVDRAFDIDQLEYPPDCAIPNEYDEEKQEYKLSRQTEWTKWFFDFESYKMKINNPVIVNKYNKLLQGPDYKNKDRDLKELKDKMIMSVHKPYMCCAVSEDGKKIVAYGDGCGKLMMDAICKNTEQKESGDETGKFCNNWKRMDTPCKKVLMIAHNCNYDYRFLQKHLYNISQKTKGSGLMNATACYMNYMKYGKKEEVRFQFKDSLKLIAMPLRKFGKCFNLKTEKEIFPYGLYTRGNLKENWVDITKAQKFLTTEQYQGFVHNCKRLKITQKIKGKKLFNMMKYAEYYCMMDCKVLKNGYETFRGWVLNEIDIDVDTVWTVASLADTYMKKNGVYDGVYQLAGVPQLFIQKCVVGGRTMCRDNVKWRFDNNMKQHKGKKMADYDGVSLYPSSMYRMEGCLKGKPKILNDEQKTYDFLQQQDGYFVKVKITDVGINRHFSLMSEVNEMGVRVFHNDMEDKIMYVDKTGLEDLIEFQDVKFDILLGYYYNDGRNPKIREVIKNIFDLRIKLKQQHNDAQLIYKLIMNSSYGKTILKPINTEEVIVSEKEKDDFIRKNYNYIMEYEKMFEAKSWRFKIHKTINEHFNNCVVGVEVLSMSKRIMNEVMCLCEDYHLTAYYQDTDSIHMLWDDVAVLKQRYTEKYGRELDGKALGQFHIDFDLYDDKGNECENVYAEKSIFLGKKCYIDCLVGEYDGKISRGFHIRMKGIPNSTIKYTAQQMNIDLYQLYEKLFYGERINFDLLEGGRRCNFKFHNNGAVSSLNKFTREIGF